MFGRLGKKPEETPSAPAGPLDRIGRRAAEEGRAEAAVPDRGARLAATAATLREAVEPKLRALLEGGAPAGEVTRQAGLLAQAHFRTSGVLLTPLELRDHVADVLRPVLPAKSFSAPSPDQAATAEAPPASTALAPAPAKPDLQAVPRPGAALPVELQAKSDKPESADKSASRLSRTKVDQARRAIQPEVMSRIDLAAAVSLPRKELIRQLEVLVS